MDSEESTWNEEFYKGETARQVITYVGQVRW